MSIHCLGCKHDIRGTQDIGRYCRRLAKNRRWWQKTPTYQQCEGEHQKRYDRYAAPASMGPRDKQTDDSPSISTSSDSGSFSKGVATGAVFGGLGGLYGGAGASGRWDAPDTPTSRSDASSAFSGASSEGSGSYSSSDSSSSDSGSSGGGDSGGGGGGGGGGD